MTIKRKNLTSADYKKIVENSVLYRSEDFEKRGGIYINILSKKGESRWLIPQEKLPLKLTFCQIEYPSMEEGN